MIDVLLASEKKDTLEQLRRVLQPHAQEWEIRSAAGAEQALAALAERPAQVVVSDLQLRGKGGADFLEQLSGRHPETVRFVLSGEISRPDAARAIASAHQVFPAAGGMELACRAIESVAALLSKAARPAVRRAIDAVHALPPLPAIYFKLREELDKPTATAASIARVIEHDPAISVRLLQMANSPYFGFGRPAMSVREATTRLGLQQIQSVVLLLAMTAAKVPTRLPRGFSLSGAQARAERVATTAAAILSVPDDRRTAFSAGMLHHVGYFVLALRMPDDYERVMAAASASGRPVDRVEAELLGCDHAEVGAFMLTLLGLPVPLAEAVALHHRPSVSKEWFGAAAAVHIACLLAAQAEGQPVPEEAWDQEFLASLPPPARALIDRWRAGEPVRAVQ
ncbi:MAG: HDOD domain-containing protein [Nevskia sp.]|nr:HDOD domain-containing protein [Nevskia sp.]